MAYKTLHKWFWVWDFDKEERWLNDMAAQGWLLDGVGFAAYRFCSCEPGEYAVRLEMLEKSASAPESQDYIGFVESTGALYLGNIAKWVYFRKKAADGAFDLFSDIDSRVAHLNRIIRFVALIGAANLCIGIGQVENLGWINLLCAALLGYAVLRLRSKRIVLEKERTLHD